MANTKAGDRPNSMNMKIQGGMLQALGINMYTTLGKSLVEFVANAYDGDAPEVRISIPLKEISEARTAVRESAKAAVEAGERDPFETLVDPLPSDVTVIIADNGHGMTWQQVRDNFLPLNRNRRKGTAKSESGKRFVMGRKGLGKLAGFGAAEAIEVWTKRKGETSATIVKLSDALLRTADNVTDVPIPVSYVDGLDPDDHGTTITLSSIKVDAAKGELQEEVFDTLAEAFALIRPEELRITINDKLVEAPAPNYDFTYPQGAGPNALSGTSFTVEGIKDPIPFSFYVGFQPRGSHLPARKRGARIYCNNRIAAGPSLFGMKTGMHYFHSQDYMECVVEADTLDRTAVDFINTNRTQLKEGNDVVRALLDKITAEMEAAIGAHGKYLDQKAKDDIQKDPKAKAVSDIVKKLPPKTRKPAQKLIENFAAIYGVDSEQFAELAPLVVTSINATEVLIKLIEAGGKPELTKVATLLRDLDEIEKNDALKLYRGRRSGIAALQVLIEQGVALWGKKQIEKQLQNLLKENPWLIRASFGRYLTSDQDVNTVVSQIAKYLKVDEFASVFQDEEKEDDTRPDLTFIMGDSSSNSPHIIHVVELKSPTFGLNIEHFRQLDNYRFQVKKWAKANLTGAVQVRGYLIGAMPLPTTASVKQQQLLAEYENEASSSQIKIVGVQQLLNEAWAEHIDAIKTLETELGDEPEDDESSEGASNAAGNGGS